MVTNKLAVVASVTLLAITPAFAVDLNTTADTYTQSTTPTSNFGSSGVIAVASGRVGLIRFNPTAVAQATGSNGTLKIKVLLTKNASNAVAVQLVTSAWNESTVNANTLPTISGTTLDQKTITGADQGKFVSFNVSAALAGWKSSPATNFGVAIVPVAPAPNLQLGSREGGSPAVLTIDGGGVVADNDVTVAKSGGDYTNPVTAADNALTGDHWCVNPQPPVNPCVMHISAGVFILPQTLNVPAQVKVVGSEKTETVLVAAKGLATAATIAGFELSDLSIVNQQDNVANAIALDFTAGNANGDQGPVNISRVSVTAAGGQNNTGLVLNGTLPVTVSDSDIIARGGNTTLGVSGLNEDGRTILRTHINVSGGSVSNTGVRQDQIGTRRTKVTDSTVIAAAPASGSATAVGLSLGDKNAGGAHEITGSFISATSPGTAFAIASGGENVSVLVVDTDVFANGGTSGIGVSHGGEFTDDVFESVRVTASTSGLSTVSSTSGAGNTTIVRSQIAGGQNAVRTQSRTHYQVSGSTLKGVNWFLSDVDEASAITVSDSTLDGAATFGGGGGTCTDVYDRNYSLLPSTCPTN